MPWYKITLSSKDIADGKGIALQNEFEKLFLAYDAPTDAGMFVAPGFRASDYHFSLPEKAVLAIRFILSSAGVPSPAPKRSEVRGLASHEGAASVPFAPEA